MRDAAGKPFKCAPATLRELRKIKKRMRPKVGSGLAGVHPFTVTDQPQVTNVKCCFCQKAFNALHPPPVQPLRPPWMPATPQTAQAAQLKVP